MELQAVIRLCRGFGGAHAARVATGKRSRRPMALTRTPRRCVLRRLGELEQFGFDSRVLPGGSRAYVRLAWLPAKHQAVIRIPSR